MSSADTLYHIFLYCDSVSLLRSAMVARDWEYESSRDDVWAPIVAARWARKHHTSMAANVDYSECVKKLSVRELKTALKERGQGARARQCVEKRELRELLTSTRPVWMSDRTKLPLFHLPVRPLRYKVKNAFCWAEVDARRANILADDLVRTPWRMFFKQQLVRGSSDDDTRFALASNSGFLTEFRRDGSVESRIIEQPGMRWRLQKSWRDTTAGPAGGGQFGPPRRFTDAIDDPVNLVCIGPYPGLKPVRDQKTWAWAFDNPYVVFFSDGPAAPAPTTVEAAAAKVGELGIELHRFEHGVAIYE